MLLKVNYFAAGKGNSLICRVFIKEGNTLLFVDSEIHLILFSNDFLHSSLMKFLFTKDANMILLSKIER